MQCLLTIVFTCLVLHVLPVLTVGVLHVFWTHFLVSDICRGDLFPVGLGWIFILFMMPFEK